MGKVKGKRMRMRVIKSRMMKNKLPKPLLQAQTKQIKQAKR
jgi:hypothetical protein